MYATFIELKRIFFRKFIRNKFLSQGNNKDREIFDFVTTATDTNLVRAILDSVNDIIINKIIAQSGFV